VAASAFAGGQSVTEIDLGNGVTLQAPDGAVQTPEQGIDSIVGRIRGDGFECQYDHGLYSNDMKSVENAETEALDLSGVSARLVTAPPDFIGLHVPVIAKTVIGDRKLTVTCHSNDQARQAVLDMLQSLHVPPAE